MPREPWTLRMVSDEIRLALIQVLIELGMRIVPAHHPQGQAYLQAVMVWGLGCYQDPVERLATIRKLGLVSESDEAREHLARLLKTVSPTIEPLPDLRGVCSQVDNVIAGLHRNRGRDAS